MIKLVFRIVFSCACVLISIVSSAQFALETPPASIKWYQINTPHFRILFPENFDREGLRMSNTLEHLYGPVSKSLLINPKKVNILMQNRNAITNGFVALGPRRSEFFTMSPQDYNFLGTNNWLDLLALHEYRHVAQNDKSLTGFTKLVYLFLGEYALSGMGFVAVPSWFKEGDAVTIETALSNSGRGRIPSFNMAMRAAYLEKGPYNYHKQYLRSFRDFVPNHYVIGYHLTSYLRNEHKENIWEPIVENAYSKSFIPFNFSNSVKKYHGKYITDTYDDMAADLVTKWSKQLEGIEISDFKKVNERTSTVFTSYMYPTLAENGDVIALKAGLSDIPTFVKLKLEGKDEKLFRPGILNDPGFMSVGKNLLVWTEYEFDPRWDKRTYSVVKSFDLASGKFSIITNKSRYTGATVSPDDLKIAVINNFHDGRVQIQLLSANLGNPLSVFGEPSYNLYTMLRWSDNGNSLTAIKHQGNEKAIVKIDSETGEEEILLDYSSENVGHPVLNGSVLFYNSPYSGIDNIYAYDITSNQKYRVTSSKYGAFNPVIDLERNWIYYNDFTADGMDVVKIPFTRENWIPIEKVTVNTFDYYKSTVEQENNSKILETVPTKDYPITQYKRGSKLFNIHSWGPYFGSSPLNYEIGILFQDVLSQNSGFAGYDWNVDENTGKWKLDYRYEGFFTAIDFSGYVGTRKATQNLGDTLNIKYDWDEKGLKTGLRIPLKLTNSKYSTRMSIANYIGFNEVTDFTNTINGNRYSLTLQGNGNLLFNEFRFSFQNLLKKAKRDIRSNWGQTFFLEISSTPYGGDFDARIASITSQLYFPGFFKHHNINFLGAYQSRKITLDTDNYLFSNRVPFPRGYSSSSWEQFYTVRSNYDFTLWNADIAMGPFLNIQRIRTKLFFDYGYGEIDIENNNSRIQGSKTYRSFGNELWFDFNFMRLLPLLSGGVRTVYVENSGWKVELVIGNIQI